LIETGTVDILADNIQLETHRKENIITRAWALCNLCRGFPLPKYEKVVSAIPVFISLLKSRLLDFECEGDILWIISFLSAR
jgi:hypothetical protein